VEPGEPKPVVESTMTEQAVPSSLPYCHTIPKNQHDRIYDEVLADDEHIVGIWYEVRCPVVCSIFYASSHDIFNFQHRDVDNEEDEPTMDVIVDVWEL
jgi:hypothetical protein